MRDAASEIGVKTTERSHWLGIRDPLWLFQGWHALVWYLVLTYTVGTWLTGKVAPIWFAVPVVAGVAWGVLFQVYEKALDRRSAGCATNDVSPLAETVRVELAGRRAEIARVVQQACSGVPGRGRFRTGVRRDQYVTLLVVGLALLPSLRVFTELPRIGISMTCVGSIVVVLLQVMYGRARYCVRPGSVAVEFLRGATVSHTEIYPLDNAHIACDFADAELVLRTRAGKLRIHLDEMYYPHRFVASVLGAAREPAESKEE